MPPARSEPTRPLQFGVTIPNNWGIVDPQQVLAMGPLAEALGYDSVWVVALKVIPECRQAKGS